MRQVRIIRESLKTLVRHQEVVLNYFREVLFQQHPEMQKLFCSPEQNFPKFKIFQFMEQVLAHCQDEARLSSYLNTMGSVHFKKGVTPLHYEWGGEALQETLRYFFREAWNIKMAETWSDFYKKTVHSLLMGMHRARAETITVEQAETVLNSPLFKDFVTIHLKELLSEAIQNEQPQARALLKMAIDKEMETLLQQSFHSDHTL
ncbi:MAG: globin domain-containing protein [Pseudobdellovibrionaceae bacterium]